MLPNSIIIYYFGSMQHILNINIEDVKEITIIMQPPGDFKVFNKNSDISRIIHCINSFSGGNVDSKVAAGRVYTIDVNGKRLYKIKLIYDLVIFNDNWYQINPQQSNNFITLIKSLGCK